MPRRTQLAIRLALHGCTNRPFYHLVVMHAYKGRDNRVIEQIGSYDPVPNYKNEKLVGISFDRFNYWYSQGNVRLTRPVEKLMGMYSELESGLYSLTYSMVFNIQNVCTQQKDVMGHERNDMLTKTRIEFKISGLNNFVFDNSQLTIPVY